MKRSGSHLAQLIILPAILFISSCKKDTTPKVNVRVRDAITNSMVSGVEVGLHRCTVYDFLCGLIAYRSNTTGNDGSCSFDKEDYDQTKSVTVSGNGYWREFQPKNSLINIYPDGWLRLRIIKGSTYPAGSTVRVVAQYIADNKSNSLQVNAAADSSILLRCYGGVSNRIVWFVESATPTAQLNTGSFFQNITRQDTVHFILNY